MTTQQVNAKLFELRKSFPENEVVINSTADFRVQDATTITLETGTTYTQGAKITTSKRFVLTDNIAIRGVGTRKHPWVYTGTGFMFTGVDFEAFSLRSATISCATARVFDLSDTTPFFSAFLMLQSALVSETLFSAPAIDVGLFTDLLSVDISLSALTDGLGTTGGITIAGFVLPIFLMRDVAMASFSPTFIGVDLGTTIIGGTFTMDTVGIFGGTAGSIGVSGLTGSANFAPGVLGSITKCTFPGAIVPFSGLSESDIRLEVDSSPPVPDSTKTADTFLTSSQTVTISTAGVFVPIGGTNWSSDVSERYSTTTAGLVTYISELNTKSQTTMTATVEKVGGGSAELQLAVGINGTEVDKTIAGTKSKDPTSLTSVGVLTTVTGDTTEAFVANVDTTANIIVSRSAVNIIDGF